MDKKQIPYLKTVFVCVNVRKDGRTACANPGRGGDEICQALKEAVKDAGLKGKIRVASSGCLGLCEKGPNLFVYPEGTWHSGVRVSDVPEILGELAPQTVK